LWGPSGFVIVGAGAELERGAAVTEQMPLTCPEHVEAFAEHAQVIAVWKGSFQVGLYESGRLVRAGEEPRCFPVALGGAPDGDKLQRGDEHTPVGWFRVTHKNPKSSFHLSLGLSYPDAEHARHAFDAGLIDAGTQRRIVAADAAHHLPLRDTAMGGDIYLHGGGAAPSDWTDGCVAFADAAIDLVYAWARPGTAVWITEAPAGS
jgi:L,D-transpeptidase catalytic domain